MAHQLEQDQKALQTSSQQLDSLQKIAQHAVQAILQASGD
jgi:hypothetical protein